MITPRAFALWMILVGFGGMFGIHQTIRQRDAAVARADSLQAVVTRWEASFPPGSAGRWMYREMELDSLAGPPPNGWKR